MPRKYLIDGILPERELSLLAGPSGGSKTTWLFQTIELWRDRVPIHGHNSHPCPFAYVSVDRSQESAEETMIRIGIDPDSIPLIRGVEENLSTIEGVLNAAKLKVPDARLYIIDGFATLVPQGKTNDYHSVANFLRNITRLCKKHDITILGLIHAAKTKENEKYLNPRERILGSVAWAGFSETLFFIAPIAPDNVVDNYRLLEILPRQSAQEKFELELDKKGRLIPSSRRQDLDVDLTSFLDGIPFDQDFSADELAGNLKVRRAKAYSILKQLQENHAVERVRSGTYRRVKSSFFAN